jgi:hypothetical protein
MNTTLKNTLYNIAHTIIMLLIAIDIFQAINPDFERAELLIFLTIVGGMVGYGFGRFWEDIVEQYTLRMPANKWDLINMTISGIVGAVLTAYIHFNVILLWVLSIISSIFVVLYFVRMWKTRLSRKKIDF